MRHALLVAGVLSASVGLVAQVEAQAQPRAIVAVYDAFAPQSRTAMLFDTDLQGGAPRDLGRFASDFLEPTAIAWDDVSREIVLALEQPGGCRIVRLEWNGAVLTQERPLALLSEPVRALAVTANGDVFAAGPSGLWRVPRLGGNAVLVLAQRAATALTTYPGSNYALLANGRESSSGTEPGYAWIELDRGTIAAGPWQFSSFAGLQITGIIDLPTGLSREVISDELGRITISEGFQDPRLIGVSPQRGPGTTVAMHAEDAFEPIVLGGAAHPWLESFTAFFQPNPTWVVRAGPFPADPRDFCLVPAPTAAAVVFGTACGQGPAWLLAPQPPQLGLPNFLLDMNGFAAQVPLVLAISTTDRNYLGVGLPIEIEPSCFLYVGLDVALVLQSNAAGGANASFAVPAAAYLADAKVYAQCMQLVPPVRFTNALALHLR